MSANTEIALTLIVVGLYFLPSFVARDGNRLPIFALNVLLGWTLVGWVVALCWALTTAPMQRGSIPIIDLAPEPEDRQPCPYCAEAILPAARVCRFCGHDLPRGRADGAEIIDLPRQAS